MSAEVRIDELGTGLVEGDAYLPGIRRDTHHGKRHLYLPGAKNFHRNHSPHIHLDMEVLVHAYEHWFEQYCLMKHFVAVLSRRRAFSFSEHSRSLLPV